MPENPFARSSRFIAEFDPRSEQEFEDIESIELRTAGKVQKLVFDDHGVAVETEILPRFQILHHWKGQESDPDSHKSDSFPMIAEGVDQAIGVLKEAGANIPEDFSLEHFRQIEERREPEAWDVGTLRADLAL